MVSTLEAQPDRVEILGCPVDALDMAETIRRCEQLIATGGPHQHMAVNVAKLVAARENAELREAIQSSAVINADGQGIVWAARLLGRPLPERVAGVDLMQELIAISAERGYRPFILGAKREVLDHAVEVLKQRHPGLQFAGTRDGYFKPEQEAEVCEEIRASKADMLFVAMGTPRKETFLAQHADDLGVPLLVGVGGAVDVIAGVTKRAPRLWQKLGAEWLYRMLQEPRRMFKRYAVTNARFAVILGRELAQRARTKK